jgi:GH25 family lysozyme M1 (1,4-beta-N-acetylmuramidase)
MTFRRKIFGFLACSVALLGLTAGAAHADVTASKTALGIDVSNHNGRVDFGAVKKDGRDFAFVLATDGNSFTNDLFDSQYGGAAKAGLFRGAYHFARPGGSATDQADRFLKTVGNRNDGRSLPPVLDLEANPNGATCYGLDRKQMKEWIEDFVTRVKEKTAREAILYTSPAFWQECTGNSKAFGSNPLWIADWGVDKPSRIGGWSEHTFWQYSDSRHVDGVDGPVDVNQFNGDVAALERFARG